MEAALWDNRKTEAIAWQISKSVYAEAVIISTLVAARSVSTSSVVTSNEVGGERQKIRSLINSLPNWVQARLFSLWQPYISLTDTCSEQEEFRIDTCSEQ